MTPVVSDPVVGRLVAGRYRVLARIAQGGMATVYRAEDDRLGRGVALKVMHQHLVESGDFVQRFRYEARAAAAISHPSVVGVYDQGEDGQLVWLAMELLPGPSVRDVLRERGGVSPAEAFRVMEALLVALDEAHRRGLVHRDVKPENILLSGDGTYKVSDFGLARAGEGDARTASGTLLGTPQYLAPETVQGGQVGPGADLYAGGIVLYELLTGRPPHTGDLPLQVAWSHVTSEVPAPSERASYLPPAVDELVARLCSRDPSGRPGSATAMLAELRRVWSRLPPAVLDATPPRPSAPGAGTAAPAPAPAAGAGLELGDTRLVAEPSRPPSAIDGDDTLTLSHDHFGTLRGRPHPPPPPEAGPGDAWAGGAPVQAWQAPAEPDGRRQRRRRGPSLAVVLLGLLMLSLGAGGALWFLELGPAAYVSVPEVDGRGADEALTTMELNGIRTDVVEEPSDDVPAGSVVRTEPEGGGRVHRDGTVTLVVSSGPEIVPMIDLRGRPLAEAEAALAAEGLQRGDVAEAYDADVEVGEVVSSSPEAGADVRRGTTVDLVLSLGPPPVVVPALVGLDEQQARDALDEAGLEVGEVTTQYAEDAPAGEVVGQAPEPGAQLDEEGEVSLVVSLGPELVEVPDVTEQRFRDAREQLEELGFVVERSGTGIFGRVILQDPDPGEQVPPGSTVTLTTV